MNTRVRAAKRGVSNKTEETPIVEKAMTAMHDRRIAYCQLFAEKSPQAEMVLEDLARFCREYSSTFHPDPRVHALVEGRREVILRIRDFLTLTTDELVKKYGGIDVHQTSQGS